MSRFVWLASVLGLFFLAGGRLPAADKEPVKGEWAQWRGPYRDGLSRETGLLKKWPEGGPKLLWEAEGLGKGFSSVVIADGKIVTMGDRDGSSHVICLNLADGKELWATKVGQPGGSYSGTRCTPTIDGDQVFALGQFGDLVALDLATGKEQWRKNFGKDFGGKKGENWGCSESPLVDGERVIFTPGGSKATMAAANRRTGEIVWTTAVPGCGAGHSSIVITEVGGIRQYVQLTTGGVIGVSTTDGKLLWRYGQDGKLSRNTANIPTPIVKGDKVFATAGYGKGGALIQLVPSGSGGIDAREIYYSGDLKNRHGGVVLVGDYLYGDTDNKGMPWCARLETGEVAWKRQGRFAGSGSVALTFADGRLYMRYDNGVMALVEATPDGYKEISTFKIPHASRQSWAHPVVVGGKLYLREHDHLMCYDIKE